MIQHISRVGKKDRASTFVHFTPKKTKIKDSEEIKKRKADLPSSIIVNPQLSDNNQLKALPKVNF